ncbi:MAG: hypothetical protein ACFFFB_05180 [Candidatus Heimdallarchaeota archaeon]
MGKLDDYLKQQINIAAYFLSHENHPYDTLCWMLAERELYIQYNFKKPKEDFIRKKAAKIFFAKPDYDVLCWLIAEKDIFLKNKGKIF